MSMEEYRKAYMEGYVAGSENAKAEEKSFFTVDDIAERYGCGKAKAGQVFRAVRRACGGGGFNSTEIIKRSELLYWETIVDKKYVERLTTGDAR